ncbi:MAG: condensation domain-containing protein [Saprospiraceae bacterium]|nr:condensation domain-containing protein [Saprospiraceae bacterium]
MKTSGKSIRKFPASAIQKQFWFISQMQPENAAYHIVEAFRIKGKLDLFALEKSINEIISRHEIFRTCFSFDDGELIQNILPELQLTIGGICLNGETKSPNEASRLLQREIERPFDLGICPLIRVTVLRLQSESYQIIFVLHHIITDLETKILFAKELSQIYLSNVKKEPFLLEKPPYQYSDYATWQKEWLLGEKSAAMCSYWESRLKGTTGVLHLPAGKKRPTVQSLKGGALPIRFSPSFTEELKQFGRQNTVNLFLVLLTVYVVMLSRYCGQNDIIVGVPLTNRRNSQHKSTMGCFVNTLPLVVSVAGDPAFKDLLHRVRLAMLGAHRNQETPFVQIVDKVKPARNPGYNPLYQAGFTFEPPMPLVLGGLRMEPVFVHHGGSQLDLFAVFWESNAVLEGFLEYNTDIFEKWELVIFADNFHSLLKSVIVDANQPISSLSVISEHEKQW